MDADFANRYPILEQITRGIDDFLASEHPAYFGSNPKHPFNPLKGSKVIHDNLWGTNGFSWLELALIDSPVFQRLRNIHQTGLAYYVYPCAHHTRFEHSLGVCIMASRVFDALQQNEETTLRKIAREVSTDEEPALIFARWRAEIRLAALLHDTGHSLHSHTSEVVYSRIPLLQEGAKELGEFVGMQKGAGEVSSFCISRTGAIKGLIDRARGKVREGVDQFEGIDLENVCLLIVGRSKHPQLQFLGEIISSDLDADKLDYLLRDAIAAGLPLRYDLERYLYTVRLTKQRLADGDDKLRNLYGAFGRSPERMEPDADSTMPYYPSYKLQLIRQAASTIEQIIICKFMLFSYIYHHKKVRAAEGMLARLIERRVKKWRAEGKDDSSIISEFLRMTDHSLSQDMFELHETDIDEYRQRVITRLLPRVVVSFTPRTACPDDGKLSAFMSELQKPEKSSALRAAFESALAERLMQLDPCLGPDKESVLARAGVWFDAPKPPKFDKLEDLFVGDDDGQIAITAIFPISSWIQAYITYRYHIRIFSFSEYMSPVGDAARYACKAVLRIDDQDFLEMTSVPQS